MKIAVIYGGTRPKGNTEILTNYIIQDMVVDSIYLRDYNILPIIDMRHSNDGFKDRNDDYNSIIETVLSNDIILFSTPIYWYSMSGTMKNFIDRWSHTLRDSQYPEFKESMTRKKAIVIGVGGDNPSIKGLPMIQQFHYIFDFIGLDFAGYVLGVGNKPGDILLDKTAFATADQVRNYLKDAIIS